VLSQTARALQEAPTPVAGMHALFDAVTVGVGSETGALGCFMVNAVAELVPYDPDVTAIAVAYSDALQQLLANALAQGAIPHGVTRTQTPEQLAAYLFNAMQGIRILIKAGASREQVDAVSAITLQSLH